MNNTINRIWRLKKRPSGMVQRENFEWTEEPVAGIEEGQILVRNLYLSFDPTQRGWMAGPSYLPAIELGEVVRSIAVGQVVESRNPYFKPGDLVSGLLGWQDYCLLNKGSESALTKVSTKFPIPLSMSVLGITGLTAYFGMLVVGEIKPGDRVVVSGAAGATGSIAAQIAKLKGGRVVGIAGGSQKCGWLRDEIELDGIVDYKSENVGPRINELLPEGVTLFFDNVGGKTLDTVLAHLSLNARVVLCGAISEYNSAQTQHGLTNYMNLIIQRAKMQGFIILDYANRFQEASDELLDWVKEGKIKYQIDLAEGLENAPETLQRLFSGLNRGKQLLKIAEAPLDGETSTI
ncbi:MAG: NADP-dependent oxidoreductase [Deltaproteobacteria bacterium]|nr:NADP-dependent oxidoreductase [Deltaproteobacteria bacterium]